VGGKRIVLAIPSFETIWKNDLKKETDALLLKRKKKQRRGGIRKRAKKLSQDLQLNQGGTNVFSK